MTLLNATHDPSLRSWVESANRPGCAFPIQNLPFTVFRRRGSREAFRGGVAIGNHSFGLLRLALSVNVHVFARRRCPSRLVSQVVGGAMTGNNKWLSKRPPVKMIWSDTTRIILQDQGRYHTHE